MDRVQKNGVILSLKGDPMRYCLTDTGYARIEFQGKSQFVHRLVANQYVSNPEGKPQVNHKDGDKLNNNYQNLEWVTASENIQHAWRTGIRVGKYDIKGIKESKLSHRETAIKFGCSKSYVGYVKNNGKRY